MSARLNSTQTDEQTVADSCQPESSNLTESSNTWRSVREKLELPLAVTAGAALLVGWLGSLTTVMPSPVSWGCYLACYLLGGFYATADAVLDLRQSKFRIDLLMIVAALGAAWLGRWGEGALLLFLFSLGHALESFALGRARSAIQSLGELTPRTAIRIDGSQQQEVSVDELQIGDTILVKPNFRVAADGIVVQGASNVNQAPITGESIPVDKWALADPQFEATQTESIPLEHRVYAGSINGSGSLHVQVTSLAQDSTLARVVHLVNEASSQKSPTQLFADRFERVFVPVVLTFVTLLLFAFVLIDEPFADSFYRAMAVLIGASPCALAISTPSAILSGVARGAQSGVLIKGGGPLEKLGCITTVAFDKTGTLTNGDPHLTDVIPLNGSTELDLLSIAILAERQSDHPLAAAVVKDGLLRLSQLHADSLEGTQSIVDRVQSVTGKGIIAHLADAEIRVGNLSLFKDWEQRHSTALIDTIESLQSQGRTTMLVAHDGKILGVLGLMDTPRQNAAAVVRQLRKLQVTRMVILSGDSQAVVDAIAQQLDIDQGYGGLMPADKRNKLLQLKTMTGNSKSITVAMVGDGVNDAPALATADVGIAMAAAGSAISLETADVALMGNDLQRIGFAIGLGRKTSRIIKQNIWISLTTVVILVPACLMGLQIGWAVVFHEGSTVAVVFNALRLLMLRDSFAQEN